MYKIVNGRRVEMTEEEIALLEETQAVEADDTPTLEELAENLESAQIAIMLLSLE